MERTFRPLDNSIYVKQNDPLLLKCLVAQREKYSRAKKYEKWNFLLIITSVVLYSVAFVCKYQLVDTFTSLFTVLFAILGGKFNKKSNELKKEAADIQQFFDCSLFSGVLNQKKEEWGNILSLEDIEWYISEIKQKSVEDVKNWYEDYSSKSAEEQIFYCQCENARWSTSLGKAFKKSLSFILVFSVVAVIVSLGKVDSCAVRILYISWSLPAIFYVYDSISSVGDDIKKYGDVKEELDELKRTVESSGGHIDVRRLIGIQNKIYEHRRSMFQVADWYYAFRRKQYEKKEKCIAKTISDEKSGKDDK